jgi:hypothetical protein
MVDKEKDFVLKEKEAGEASGAEGAALPAIDFSTFIMSLNASALVHLGIIDDPTTGQRTKNLPLGKQTVDMLRMLQEKTRGNLTEEEDKLLQGILYDLKIAYVRQRG